VEDPIKDSLTIRFFFLAAGEMVLFGGPGGTTGEATGGRLGSRRGGGVGEWELFLFLTTLFVLKSFFALEGDRSDSARFNLFILLIIVAV
jgi:hypothetical protein